MEKNYAYEIEKAIKEKYKEEKKRKEIISVETKNNLEKMLVNIKNSKKLEVLYKNRYNVLNNDIYNPELSEIYSILLQKIIETDENSVLFTEWNNIFVTVFGNMPAIYKSTNINYVKKIVDMIHNSKDESKLKVLMKLFVVPYIIEKEDMKFIDLLIFHISNTEENYKFKSYETIIDKLHLITSNEFINEYKNMILNSFANSISRFNTDYLLELLDIFLDNERKVENKSLLYLFKIFSESDNRELIYAYYELMRDPNFTDSSIEIQNSCFMTLKNIGNYEILKTRYITRIILEIIVLSENKKIQNYLLEKIKTIKNVESLELILYLAPLLNDFASEEEYINVINSLEDKNNNLTKKLIINLDIEE